MSISTPIPGDPVFCEIGGDSESVPREFNDCGCRLCTYNI